MLLIGLPFTSVCVVIIMLDLNTNDFDLDNFVAH